MPVIQVKRGVAQTYTVSLTGRVGIAIEISYFAKCAAWVLPFIVQQIFVEKFRENCTIMVIMLALGILASGRGSNFQAIMDSIQSGYLKATVAVLITDNPRAYAVERAKKSNIETLVLAPKDFPDRDSYYRRVADELKGRNVGLVILAGFMRVVGKPLIDAFRNKIMNIHPALLPSFPGLHGQKQAADYGVKLSGCTVHFVDEGMDTGPIIIQAAVPSYHDDTEDTLAERILKQEHRIFPYAIKLFSEGSLLVEGRKVVVRGPREDSVMINPSCPS